MSILQRIFGSWKSTVGGISVGVAAMALVEFALVEAGITIPTGVWSLIMAAAGLGPAVVGALTTDNGAKVG